MSDPGRTPCVVAIRGTRPGLHAGVVYRIDDEDEQYLHLEWHLKLRRQVPPPEGFFVESALKRAKRLAVANQAAVVAEKYTNGAVPFGFGLVGVTMLSDGSIELNGSSGLTCASFVAVLHESAGAALILPESWDERSQRRLREDESAQEGLVAHLRRDNHHKQAERLEREVGCTRVRSEEIAASSGLPHRPVDFSAAEPAGRDVLAQLDTLSRR